MPRLLFEKTGNAVWLSHLDLMRLFQRAFKRAELPLTHTQGFNPRPSVSIAMPLSVGVESRCELLDFELEGATVPAEEICRRLNEKLVSGVRILEAYDGGRKLRELALLSCCIELEYHRGVPTDACQAITHLFAQQTLVVEKKGKNGITQQDICPPIRHFSVEQPGEGSILIQATICCQNPSLNPMQIPAAIEKYLPEFRPDFARCCRLEIYDETKTLFR